MLLLRDSRVMRLAHLRVSAVSRLPSTVDRPPFFAALSAPQFSVFGFRFAPGDAKKLGTGQQRIPLRSMPA